MPVERFEIQIVTTAEMQGARAQLDSLLRQRGAAKALGNDYSDLDAQIKRCEASLAQMATGKSGNLGGLAEMPGVSKIAGVFEGLAGPAAAAASAVALATAAVHKFSEAEVRDAKLQTALAQAGKLSDETREKYAKLISALKEETGKNFTDVLTRLTQFGSQNIEKDAEAVKNLAGILNGDIDQASTVFARAMNGNYQSLHRVGIIVPEHLSQMEKMKFIYEELEKKGGGQLAAAQNTLAGAFEKTSSGSGKLLKNIGQNISEFLHLKAALDGLGTSLNWFAGLIGHPIAQLEGLKNAAKATVLSEEVQPAEALAAALGKVGDSAKVAKDELSKLLDHLKSQKEAMDAVAKASTDLALARIRNSTTLSDYQKAVAANNITAMSEEDRHRRNVELAEAEIDSIKRNAEAKERAANKAKDAHESTVEDASKAVRFRRAKEDFDAANKALTDYDSTKAQQDAGTAFAGGPTQEEKNERAALGKNLRDKEQALLEAGRGGIRAGSGRDEPAAAKAAQDAEEKAKAAKAELEKIPELSRQIKTENSVYDLERKKRETESAASAAEAGRKEKGTSLDARISTIEAKLKLGGPDERLEHDLAQARADKVKLSADGKVGAELEKVVAELKKISADYTRDFGDRLKAGSRGRYPGDIDISLPHPVAPVVNDGVARGHVEFAKETQIERLTRELAAAQQKLSGSSPGAHDAWQRTVDQKTVELTRAQDQARKSAEAAVAAIGTIGAVLTSGFGSIHQAVEGLRDRVENLEKTWRVNR